MPVDFTIMTTQEEYRRREEDQQREAQFRHELRKFFKFGTAPVVVEETSAEQRERVRNILHSIVDQMLAVPDAQVCSMHMRFLQMVGEKGYASDGQCLCACVKHEPALLPAVEQDDSSVFSKPA